MSDEYVKLSLENYEKIKEEFDKFAEKIEKMEKSICKVEIIKNSKYSGNPPFLDKETYFLNSTAPEDLTKFFKENVADAEKQKEIIESYKKIIKLYKSTWIYKLITFFTGKIL